MAHGYEKILFSRWGKRNYKGAVGTYSHTGVVEDHANLNKLYRYYFCPFPFLQIFIKAGLQRIYHRTGVAAVVEMEFL